MRADDHIDAAEFQVFQYLLLFFWTAEAGQELNVRGKGREALTKSIVMLKRKNGRRSEHCRLFPIHNGFECRPHSDFGFSIAYISP